MTWQSAGEKADSMTRMISLHSFSEGAGRTTLAANIAALMAQRAQRVALLCARADDPTLARLFSLRAELPTLQDYIRGAVSIVDIAQDVSEQIGIKRGKLYVAKLGVPSDVPPSLNALSGALDALNEALKLDIVLIENPHGLARSALMLIALADLLTVVMLLDQAHYQGTSVLLDVADRLSVPMVRLIVNRVPPEFSQAEVKQRVEETYRRTVAVVVPETHDLNGRTDLIALHNTTHAFSAACSVAAAALLEAQA
jgi:MinD-like ATPase involved in chromosome partitioning or flagellar assembly